METFYVHKDYHYWKNLPKSMPDPEAERLHCTLPVKWIQSIGKCLSSWSKMVLMSMPKKNGNWHNCMRWVLAAICRLSGCWWIVVLTSMPKPKTERLYCIWHFETGHLLVVQFSVSKRADVTAETSQGHTPLYVHCMRRNHQEVVWWLMRQLPWLVADWLE